MNPTAAAEIIAFIVACLLMCGLVMLRVCVLRWRTRASGR